MRTFLLGLASIGALAITAPTHADNWNSGQPVNGHGPNHPGPEFGQGRPDHRGDHRGDHRRFRDGGAVIADWYGGEWALYNNRTFEPDSYNDWWHDRPDRAFPRWMAHNQDCSRQWYSGDTLRC